MSCFEFECKRTFGYETVLCFIARKSVIRWPNAFHDSFFTWCQLVQCNPFRLLMQKFPGIWIRMGFFNDIGYVHVSIESICSFVVLKYFKNPVKCSLERWVLVQLSKMVHTLLRNDQSKIMAILLLWIWFRISVIS